MQYILTEKEYADINNVYKNKIAKMQTIINNLCIDVATYKPTFCGWDGKQNPRPWGCHHAKKSALSQYCDECTVIENCTLVKNFSK